MTHKLEIGAGERPTPGYIHQDIRPLDDIEIICDARDIELSLHYYEPFEEIRACHVLEHFSYTEVVKVLKTWKNVLEENGILHIEVPNFSWQTSAHARGEISDREAVYFVFGEQNYEENSHKNGFTGETLFEDLEAAGFKDVSIQNIGQVLVARARKNDN